MQTSFFDAKARFQFESRSSDKSVRFNIYANRYVPHNYIIKKKTILNISSARIVCVSFCV